MVYRIKTVSEMTGIPRETILAWERRYGLVKPARSSNGYRAYSDSDVEVLQELKDLVDQGLQISEAIARRRAEQQRQRAALQAPAPDSDLHTELCQALQERLLSFDRAGADKVHRQLATLSFRDRLDRIYTPLLHDVGAAWERGEASVAQEHFATAFVREQVMALLHGVQGGPRGGPRVLCAGLPGESHELGLLQTAARLALAGMRVTYLGGEMPVDELVAVAQRIRPELVCQSAVLRRWRQSAATYARKLLPRLPESTLLVLGGPGVEGVEEGDLEGVLFCATLDELLERWKRRPAVG